MTQASAGDPDIAAAPTFLAPARRTMSTICRIVVPRTMESSTSSTLRPSNTAGMALSFRRTDSSRRFCAVTGHFGEDCTAYHPVAWAGRLKQQGFGCIHPGLQIACSFPGTPSAGSTKQGKLTRQRHSQAEVVQSAVNTLTWSGMMKVRPT